MPETLFDIAPYIVKSQKPPKRKMPKHQGNFNTKSLDYITSAEPLKDKFCDTIKQGLKSFDKLKKLRDLYL